MGRDGDESTYSTICLCLTPEIKYNILNETSIVNLWKKLENMYMFVSHKSFIFKEGIMSIEDG